MNQQLDAPRTHKHTILKLKSTQNEWIFSYIKFIFIYLMLGYEKNHKLPEYTAPEQQDN